MFSWVLIGFMACNEGAVNTPAKVTDAPTTSTPVTTEAGDVSLSMHKDSTIEWVGSKVLGQKQKGGFKDIQGTAIVDKDGKLKSVTATINILSLYSAKEKLTKHLLNEDFFLSSQFATATFTSRKITDTELTGTLNMRGVKKEITFDATTTTSNDQVNIVAELAINRKDWGINYAGKADNLILDDVDVSLNVKYTK